MEISRIVELEDIPKLKEETAIKPSCHPILLRPPSFTHDHTIIVLSTKNIGEYLGVFNHSVWRFRNEILLDVSEQPSSHRTGTLDTQRLALAYTKLKPLPPPGEVRPIQEMIRKRSSNVPIITVPLNQSPSEARVEEDLLQDQTSVDVEELMNSVNEFKRNPCEMVPPQTTMGSGYAEVVRRRSGRKLEVCCGMLEILELPWFERRPQNVSGRIENVNDGDTFLPIRKPMRHRQRTKRKSNSKLTADSIFVEPKYSGFKDIESFIKTIRVIERTEQVSGNNDEKVSLKGNVHSRGNN